MKNINDQNIIRLNDAHLEAVSGGDDQFGARRFSGQVAMNKGVVGQKYYVVSEDHSSWCYAKLVGSYDSKNVGGTTMTRHRLEVFQENGRDVHYEELVSSDAVKLYLNMD